MLSKLEQSCDQKVINTADSVEQPHLLTLSSGYEGLKVGIVLVFFTQSMCDGVGFSRVVGDEQICAPPTQ